MNQFKQILLKILRFLGIIVLADLGLFVVVSVWCLIGTRCTEIQWSERMFWAGLLVMMLSAPAMIATLGGGRGNFDNSMTAGMDMQIADAIIKDQRKSMDKRSQFALYAASIGVGGIVISALIEYFLR